MTAWRDIAVVAEQELSDSLRSKRVLVLALLFLGGSVAGTYAFVQVLRSIEAAVATTLAVDAAATPGAMTRELMRTPEVHRVLTGLIKDADLAAGLVGLPPLALFYGWLGLTFAPVLVTFTAVETVAAELSSGSARFSLVRTERLRFSAGKLLGQAMLMALSVAAGALGCWVTGYLSLDGFEPGRTAYWLALLSLRVGVMGFAYLGLAVGLSHLTRSVPLSRALGLLTLALLAIVRGLLSLDWSEAHLGWLGDLVLPLLPRSHQVDLWRPALLDRLPAMVALAALGLATFAAGFRFRARRDA